MKLDQESILERQEEVIKQQVAYLLSFWSLEV